MSKKRPASNKNQRKESKISKLDEEIQMSSNSLIGHSGFSNINQIILSCLDHDSQMSFRHVCQSWKAQMDHPQFWIKKLDLKGCQPKELQKEWIDFVGRIQKGSKLEKEVTECLMKLYGEHKEWINEIALDLDEMTPIFMAARFDAINIVKFVASYKNISYSPNTNRETPLHMAAECGSTEVFKFMASIVENPNAPNTVGETPLHIAAVYGSTEIFKFMASKVENPNAPNTNGETPLHIAAECGSTEIFKFMASKVDNPNAPNADGETPFEIATSNNQIEIVSILFKVLSKKVKSNFRAITNTF